VIKEVKVKENGNPEVQCIFCICDSFRGGVTRIRAYILGYRLAGISSRWNEL